jgi:flagellar protein FliJ
MFERTRRRRLQPVAGAARRHFVAKMPLRGTRRLKPAPTASYARGTRLRGVVQRFSFKLESVLAYRKLLEDGEGQKLTRIQTAILETEHGIRKTGLEISHYMEVLKDLTRGTIDIERLRHFLSYLDKLRDDQLRASRQLLKLKEDWQIQRRELMEARKKREIVEKLKHKSQVLHDREAQVLERKLLDEISVMQFGRQSRQEFPPTESDS